MNIEDIGKTGIPLDIILEVFANLEKMSKCQMVINGVNVAETVQATGVIMQKMCELLASKEQGQ